MSEPALIAAAALAALPGVALFDCRFDLADPAAGEAAFLDHHLPGARYLHLDRDLSGPPTGANGRHPLPDRATLAATLRANGVGAGQRVVAYDASGGAFAARAWWLLRWLGHRRVQVLDGGLPAWVAAGGPLVAGPAPPVAAGDFQAAASLMPVRTAAEVPAAARLVDARAPARFAGGAHPLDAVAGHIPGAINRFFADNLAGDGRFKPAHTLAAEYRALLAGVPAADTVVYCGSGVTAAHNLLAMAVAGLPGAALYPGSWSEWVADPARPVAR